MSYDDVEIEDMEWNEEIQAYTYPCPCGDLFQITKEDLRLGEEIANCPSCSLYITVIYNMEDFQNDTKKNNEPKTQNEVFAMTDDKKATCNHEEYILNPIVGLLVVLFSDYLCEGFLGEEETKGTRFSLAKNGEFYNHHDDSSDNNPVYSPCSDTQISKGDGFTIGIAISSKEAFFLDQVQLSPCDSRLGLAGKMAQLALFRPKVDEISLLSIDTSKFNPSEAGGFMVGFAGSKYAARSYPVKVADGSNTITAFTLVLEFQKGVLQNLFWKSFGCDSCKGIGSSSSVCLNGTDCAVPTSKCKANGGEANCNIGIQVAFSGTDKNLESLNTWYEVNNLRQYSLTDLYANAVDSLSGGLL
ncbi:Zinc finger DPH-type [Arabidopsis thaliana x Arabidopsis arenosa]|uniref:Zinc finger DPH-type n=1 Tax=Arabidopsis thaliana x Arabidopsis arenosa TaxID=1240361 RepID=A0A8T2B108_9BRAS|nr:Zinc finger DPH-type [Arabidopsis thaliana x Arabidopsis arenosa]